MNPRYTRVVYSVGGGDVGRGWYVSVEKLHHIPYSTRGCNVVSYVMIRCPIVRYFVLFNDAQILFNDVLLYLFNYPVIDVLSHLMCSCFFS